MTGQSPPTLGHLLQRLDRSRIDPFLTLREALLALPDVEERILRAGDDWVPAFYFGERELLRVRLVDTGPEGVTVVLVLPPEIRSGLARLSEVRPAARKRIEALPRNHVTVTLALPLASEEDLTEVVSLALALHGRIGGAR